MESYKPGPEVNVINSSSEIMFIELMGVSRKIIFSNSSDNQPVSSTVDELLKLKQLLDGGVLTEEEFQQQKIKMQNN